MNAPIDTPSGAEEGSRSSHRTRVLMGGILFTPEGVQRVRIRDVSPTGAQVTGETAIPHACDAIFKRGSVFVAAKITRSRQAEAGLEFYRELSSAEVDSMFHCVMR
jgi:hypothetical protein